MTSLGVKCETVAESFSNRSALFSHNQKQIFLPSVRNVYRYATSTGLLQKKFSTTLQQDIVQIKHHVSDNKKMIACAIDGSIASWDPNSCDEPDIFLQPKNASFERGEFKVVDFCQDPVNPTKFYFLSTKVIRKKYLKRPTNSKTDNNVANNLKQNEKEISEKSYNVSFFSYDFTEKISSDLHSILIESKSLVVNQLVAISEEIFAFAVDNTVVFLNINMKKKRITKFYHSKLITAFDFDPHQKKIAIGDKYGAIFVVDLDSVMSSKKPQPEKYHWHSQAVKSLKFTAFGANLLSGGSEAVLVNWQIGTKRKSFLPRVGGEITSIFVSADESLVGIMLSSNTVHVISYASFKVVRSIEGVKCLQNGFYSSLSPKAFKPILKPNSEYVLLPTLVGNIQYFNYETCNHSYFQDILGKNAIFSNIAFGSGSDKTINLISFSFDAQVMVSYESVELNGVVRSQFKIWMFREEIQRYEIATVVDTPHFDCVKSIVFSPSSYQFISCGADKSFKVWTISKSSKSIVTVYSDHNGTYKECVPVDAKYSQDGSMFAVAFETSLAFYKTATFELIHVFSSCSPSPILDFIFLPNLPFVVILRKGTIIIFNLVSVSVWWSLAFKPGVSEEIVHLFDDKFMILIARDEKESFSNFLVLSPASREYVFKQKISGKIQNLCKIDQSSGESQKFLATVEANGQTQLSFITIASSVKDAAVEEIAAESSRFDSSSFVHLKEQLMKKSFDGLFSVAAKSIAAAAPSRVSNIDTLLKRATDTSGISSLALPPIDRLCDAFFDSMFLNKH